jgi:hypothetical protein
MNDLSELFKTIIAMLFISNKNEIVFTVSNLLEVLKDSYL